VRSRSRATCAIGGQRGATRPTVVPAEDDCRRPFSSTAGYAPPLERARGEG
jgi:hypothetical protein